MSGTTFQVAKQDATELRAALNKNLRDIGVSMQFLGRDMMRVYVNNLVKMSFPANKKQGVAAIDADLSKVFAVLDNPDVLEFFNAQFGDGSAAKSGALKGKKRRASARKILPGVAFNWDGNQGRMRGWHKKFRVAGKVRKSSRTVASVGQWRFGDEMYVTRTAYNRYRRGVLKSVSKFKSGWVAAVDYYARVTGGPARVPAFTRKHSNTGTYHDGFTRFGTGSATATNKVGYADRMTRFILKRAQMKAEAYTQKATKKQAEKIAERFNKVRAAA